MTINKALTVTEFVAVIDEGLAAFDGITVEGEVGEYAVSGQKWVRFVLQDKESSVRCFMPIWDLKTQIEDGMMVRASGRPKLTQKWGFSFNTKTVIPAGEGALRRALELLKKKLTLEGLFALERKRALPRFPQHVALITSKEAAAYKDFIKVLKARQGGMTISFIHSQVQGEAAPQQIKAALEQANTELKELDVVVMVRGGGSLEDLQAFNDEGVVRAVAASRAPIIVGVGHERDVTLAELAADVRASTPSNAAELLVEGRLALSREISQLRSRVYLAWRERLDEQGYKVKEQMTALKGAVVTSQNNVRQLVVQLAGVGNRIKQKIQSDIERVNKTQRMLIAMSPADVLRRGFSITRDETGKVIKRADMVGTGEVIVTQLAINKLRSRVE